MSNVYFYLRKRPNRFGLHPLLMMFSKDSKQAPLTLRGITMSLEDWDEKKQRVKKSHPNSVRLNNFLTQKLAGASGKTIEAVTANEDVSSKTLREKVKQPKSKGFFEQAEQYLNHLQQVGKYNEYTADKPRIKHFKEFLNCDDVKFSEIDVPLLNSFKHYLKIRHTLPPTRTVIVKRATKTEPAIRKPKAEKPYKETSIENHFVAIRSVYSFADKNGNVDKKKHYPFGEGKFTISSPDTEKIGLSAIEIQRLESLQIVNANHNHARNVWLIAFYFGGIRAADVLSLKWSDIREFRLHYIMNKNGKTGSLKVSEKALKIFDQYVADKRGEDDFIFPELKRLSYDELIDEFKYKQRIANCTSRLDKFLRLHVAPAASIFLVLTLHVARHSVGNIATDKIPITVLQGIFRHSSITTTARYMKNFIHSDADEALDIVTNF